ncbi:MAG: hypothetical protein J7J82_07075 [Staphylothermus sp.]|nr:hypothetical protein [Staphylothermus sp.]
MVNNLKNRLVTCIILGIIMSLSLAIIVTLSFNNNPTYTEEWETIYVDEKQENNVKITETVLKNQYATIRLYKIFNGTNKIALIKVEDYCKYCYPNIGLTSKDRLKPEHIERVKEFKEYIDNLWIKHNDFIKQHNVIVNAYVVPSKALSINEFKDLISKLRLGKNISWIYYTVYDKEFKYVMSGTVKVTKNVSYALSIIRNDVETYFTNKKLNNENTSIYICAFIINTKLRTLYELQKNEHIGFVYVPVDILKELINNKYSYIEIKYATIIQATPDIDLKDI